MARTTITDVRERVERLNDKVEQHELEFSCWGVGESKYQLIDKKTGKTFGPVCVGASEFIVFLKGFKAGRRL